MARNGPKREKKVKVWRRDHYRCRYCGRPVETPSPNIPTYLHATVDHKTPRSKGGGNSLQNLVTACMACNSRKANQGHKEFLASGAAKLSYNGGFRSLKELQAAQAMEARSGETRSGSTEGDSAVAKPCAQYPSGSNRHG